MAAVAAVLAAVGVQNAIRVPPLNDIEVAIPGLPSQFDGYTMLQLTDLHISRLFPEAWARAVVERSNKLAVDLIAITGDLIDGTPEARQADVEPLQDLQATDGVHVISGNHEYIFGYGRWMARYAALGLRSLENRHIVLDRDGAKLVIAGITDRASRRKGHPVRDLAAILEAVWEVIENTNFVIDRYRAQTAALGYTGDTVVNSIGDLCCAIAGFLIARRLGWFRAVIAFLLLEVVLFFWIRDSLLLQILMLIYPVNALKLWQMCR
jgi:predicted MPP superfamily phosphohydrolase